MLIILILIIFLMQMFIIFESIINLINQL